MASEKKHTCPTCAESCAPAAANRYFPFCSERCQLIDLGRWLDGDYVIPGTPAHPGYRDDDEGLM